MNSSSHPTRSVDGVPSKNSPRSASVLALMGGPFSAWLLTRSAREQLLIKALLAGFVAFLLWTVLVWPALHSIHTSTVRAEVMQREWAQLLSLKGELKSTQSVAPLSPEQSGAAIKDAVTKVGPLCKVTLENSSARLQLKGLSPQGLAQLLPELRERAQAQILEVNLRVDAQSKLWEGTVILALPSARP